jgi:hypothetical protein
MNQEFVKGIECINCQAQFTWQSLPKTDKIGLTSCVCPKCRTHLKQLFPITEIFMLLIVGTIFISLLMWSNANASQNITFIICGIGLVIGHFTRKLVFNGYVRTRKIES